MKSPQKNNKQQKTAPRYIQSPTKQKKSSSPNRHLDPDHSCHQHSPGKATQSSLQSNRYFCHYQNAVYMGGMKCFKKLGYGIMLLDNGACAITCHSHDNMINQNIIFRDGSVTSLLIGLNRTKSICFRIKNYLLYFNMSEKDLIEGVGYFINYLLSKLYKLKFQNGKLILKQRVQDSVILRKVFGEKDYKGMVDDEHIKAISLNFDLPQQMKYYKSGNKLTVGFYDVNNKIKGLFFSVFFKQTPTDFDVMLQQRGYMENGQMTKFGQRHFQNGNYYIGQFKNDKYSGQGLLVYPKQKKWTFGQFLNGQIKQVKDSDVINQSGYPNCIYNIHQTSTQYIKFKIDLKPTIKWLQNILGVVNDKDPYEHQSIDYTKKEKKRINNLNTVQQDYTTRKYEVRTQQAVKQLLSTEPEKNMPGEGSESKLMSRVNTELSNRSRAKSKDPNTQKRLSSNKDRLKTQVKLVNSRKVPQTQSQQKKKRLDSLSNSKTKATQKRLSQQRSTQVINLQSPKYQNNSIQKTPSPINKMTTSITKMFDPAPAQKKIQKQEDPQQQNTKQFKSTKYRPLEAEKTFNRQSPTSRFNNTSYSPNQNANYRNNDYLLNNMSANLINPHINSYPQRYEPPLRARYDHSYPYLTNRNKTQPIDITYFPEYIYTPLQLQIQRERLLQRSYQRQLQRSLEKQLEREAAERVGSTSPYSRYPLAYPKSYRYVDDDEDWTRNNRLSNQRYRNFHR